MKTVTKQSTQKAAVAGGKQRSYAEVVEFLDNNWRTNLNDKNLTCITKLDKAFNTPSKALNVITVAGTNGKSLTMHFAAKLLKEEGLTVGAFYAPHILTYNERFVTNNEIIANKTFTDIANEVINTAESLELEANSLDILTMMALLYFKSCNVDVVLLEVSKAGVYAPTNICTPKIAAITRIAEDEFFEKDGQAPEAALKDLIVNVQKGTFVVSADQSKINLQGMLNLVEAQGGTWAMPIRKLAQLSYPFEQLQGRCAALAERIASIYINDCAEKNATVIADSLLMKKEGLRGRPTIEAKRHSELNPQRTIEQFWKEQINTLPGRFQLLDKEKPTVLLDTACNLDSFQNLLLGIRLLHYSRPLKGLTLILGSDNESINMPEFLKLLRYFFKKTSGQIIVCPVTELKGNHRATTSWDAEKVTNDIKSMKIKAKSAKNFAEAFEAAEKTVDERHGLVVVAGSASIVSEYWAYKGIKRV